MRSQIPKLLESNPRYIHNIIALCYRCPRVIAIRKSRAERQYEADQVLVEGE